MSRILGVALLGVLAASPAFADRPRDVMVWEDVKAAPLTPQGTVPYNTIFLNRCASGCAVAPGTTNSTTTPDKSSLVSSTRTLTAYPGTDAQWNSVVQCVKDVFSPFNVTITDVDPGTANHFEIMIAGSPGDLGMSAGIGGVSPFQCSSAYIPNALVFDFAKVWDSGTNIEEICSTAAQEIAHAFTLDHVTVAADPLTYFGYQGRRYYQNTAAQCGSDCVGGVSPFNQTCSGTNQQEHACACTGQNTQNSVQTIGSLFGLGPGTPPTVTLTTPGNGDQVDPGFHIVANAVDDSGIINKVDFKLDGQLLSSLTIAPYVVDAPMTLGNGTHDVEVTAYDPHGTPGTAKATVYIGPPCKTGADCPIANDACVGGRCIPGSGVDGGLGSTCMTNTDCLDGNCASDGTHMYCTVPCMKGQCPGDFGCLDTGGAMGICWPGYDDGSGGCSVGNGGPISLGLAFAALLFTRRRKR